MKALGSIQVLRGVAALAVMVFHARQELAWRGIAVPLPDLTVGAAGVDLFFVISGFVMAYASRPLFGSTASVVPFLVRRCARIVPLYWLYTLVRLVYVTVSNRHSALLDDLPTHLAASLAFVPQTGGVFPFLVQGWTLNYEMAFYLCFGCCLPLGERKGLVAIAAVLVVLAALGGSGLAAGRFGLIANPQLLEFLAGIVVARLHAAGLRLGPAARAALLAAAAAAVATSLLDTTSWWAWRGLVWGVPAGVVLAAATLGRRSAAGTVPPGLRLLGDASYSLYLTHMLSFTIVSRVALKLAFAHPVGALAYFALSLVVATLAGLASYRWVERPMTLKLMAGIRNRFPGETPVPFGEVHPAPSR